MALKDDISDLEKRLNDWSRDLSRSSDANAGKIGKDMEAYVGNQFRYKLKDHFIQAMKHIDDRFYMS